MKGLHSGYPNHYQTGRRWTHTFQFIPESEQGIQYDIWQQHTTYNHFNNTIKIAECKWNAYKPLDRYKCGVVCLDSSNLFAITYIYIFCHFWNNNTCTLKLQKKITKFIQRKALLNSVLLLSKLPSLCTLLLFVTPQVNAIWSSGKLPKIPQDKGYSITVSIFWRRGGTNSN